MTSSYVINCHDHDIKLNAQMSVFQLKGDQGNPPIWTKYIVNQKSGSVRTFLPILDLVHMQIFIAFPQELEPGWADKHTHKQTNKHLTL